MNCKYKQVGVNILKTYFNLQQNLCQALKLDDGKICSTYMWILFDYDRVENVGHMSEAPLMPSNLLLST